MPEAVNTSSSPAAELHLLRVPLADLHPHPANANVMSEARLATLMRHIARDGRYPPLVVRPHPEQPNAWQILDGAHRREALQRLGHGEALVYPWACDDTTALLLLATLNRLQGADVPALRAQLLQDLSGLVSETELLALIPEDAEDLAAALEVREVDTASLLAELEAAHARAAASGPRLISFAVDRDEEPLIEAAIATAMATLTGRNRRGRALAAICRQFLGAGDA